MLKQLNEQIASLKLELRHKLNWEQQVKALSRELEQQRRIKEQWAARLEREKRDVERLEKLSLGALFYTLTGKKEEKLSKEEAEVLQAKLRYEEASDTVVELEQEIADLNRKLANLKHVEDEYNRAIQEKRLLIERLHPALAETLHDLTGQEEEMRANVKELQEAIAAGRTAKNSLGRAEVLLNKAKDWGTFDMLGGGLLSTAMKHTRIDEARSAIHEAQRDLRRFQTELLDVRRDVNIEIELGSLLTFADYFFDNLITDWMVQGRIKRAIEELENKSSHINHLIRKLEEERRQAEERIQELQREKLSLIEQAE